MAIRTAIIGYGRSGSSLHADPLEALSEYEVVAVCDPDKERQKIAHQRFGCPTYSGLSLLLKKEKIDLACIITRSDQHTHMAIEAMTKGAHVLVTKPMAVNATQAKKMLDVSKKYKKILAPWQPSRWGTDFTQIKKIITGGKIGKVFSIQRNFLFYDVRNDWQTKSKFGGGYLLNWGAHLVDQIIELVDKPVEAVWGKLWQVINPGDVEDSFKAVLTFKDSNIVGEINVGIGTEQLPRWFIQGSKGTITSDKQYIYSISPEEKPEFRMKSNKGDIIQRMPVGKFIYGDAFIIYEELAQAIRGKNPFAVTPESVVNLMKVLDAVRESNKRKKTIKL
ncbi:MAG: Gfo/Idh/MocA family oxidoreductase [bacterium]